MRWLALALFVSMPALADLAPPEPAAPVPAVVATDVAPAPAPQHPGGNENAPGMTMGVIQGGWAYVYAAWGAGIFGLVLYAASLFLRRSTDLPPGAP